MASQSAVEETRRCLDNIEQFDSLVNAYIVVIAESALKEAEAIDQAREKGISSGVLNGLPISVKDCIDVAGIPCTNGSSFFADYVPNTSGRRTRETENGLLRRIRICIDGCKIGCCQLADVDGIQETIINDAFTPCVTIAFAMGR